MCIRDSLYTDPSPSRDLAVLKPNNAVMPEPSFLSNDKFELCRFFTNLGIFLSFMNTLLIPKEKIKKTIFRSTISDLSGKFARIKLKYFSEFFVSSSLKFGYKLEKMILNDLDILLSIYIFYRLLVEGITDFW